MAKIALYPLLLGLALTFLPGCRTTATQRLGAPPLTTVASVDLQRYLGTWYEIAAFPQSFQKGCTATTANYSLAPEGHIVVVNRCRRGGLEAKEDEAKGRARVVDPETNARLEVSFFRPFWGDYWIIDLGADYEYAVVGHPGRDYLWILSRQPWLEEAVYAGILERLKAQHYELERLVKTLHPPRPEAETETESEATPPEVGSPL
ncbi:MAG: lipocalin family protein [Deltaproteobacteria bacterium]|nr:lipocalin family protein [Deltaproteobacteria bacterium]